MARYHYKALAEILGSYFIEMGFIKRALQLIKTMLEFAIFREIINLTKIVRNNSEKECLRLVRGGHCL